MSRRQSFGACSVVVFALLALPAFGDEAPTLVKVRLKGGRAIVVWAPIDALKGNVSADSSPPSLRRRDARLANPSRSRATRSATGIVV